MENFHSRISNFKLLIVKKFNSALYSFSRRERIVFLGLVVILLFSTIAILEGINRYFMTDVPLYGGSISAGIVGTPRFVNPIVANSLADQDLVALIYSGLLRKSSDGTLIPDLAEKYESSKDGLVYTFTLRDDLYFHDGEPLSVDDIIFTINKVKDPVVKSLHKVNWDGVTVLKIDEKTIQFTLKQPYASFLENTTLGVMPEHVWGDSPLELNDANTNPIGSGPYMISSLGRQSSGIIDSYELESFKEFVLGRPYIKNISLHFYPNEDDLVSMLLNKTVSQVSSITPQNAENLREKGYQVESSVLPRVFGLFFNQNVNRLFTEKAIVTAINQAIDKDKIVESVLLGYGTVIDSPMPPNLTPYQKPVEEKNTSREEILQKVKDDLAKAGWKTGPNGFLEKKVKEKTKTVTTPLQFSISTGNIPELAQAAELIKQDLESIGMKVDVKTFDIGNLNQNVIRPRKYDALLFGEIINHESDLFAFWHSSQRKDPGLNVAMYTNSKVDKILEDASITVDEESRIKKYIQFRDEIIKDMPTVFLYSPHFIYVASNGVMQFKMDRIITPSDRLLNAHLWYKETENVWKIFAR